MAVATTVPALPPNACMIRPAISCSTFWLNAQNTLANTYIVNPYSRMGFLPNFSLSGPQNNNPTEKNKKNMLSVMLTLV